MSGWPLICYVANDSFELWILLSHVKFLCYKHAPLHLVYMVLHTKPRTSCMLAKHSPNRNEWDVYQHHGQQPISHVWGAVLSTRTKNWHAPTQIKYVYCMLASHLIYPTGLCYSHHSSHFTDSKIGGRQHLV